MPLSDAAVRAAKPREKPYKLADSLGLYLLVTDKGRYWRVDYRFEKLRRTLAIGVYPAVGLAAARMARDRAREQLSKGIDPSTAKRAAAGRSGTGEEFETIGREWFEKNKTAWAESHWSKVLLRLEGDIFPWIGKRQARRLVAADFLSVARRVEKRGAIESAHRVLQYCSSIMRYAVATQRADGDPVPALRGALAPVVRGSFASIRAPAELGKLLAAIDGCPGSFVVAMALRLAPHLFVRPTELRHMEWAELDLEEGSWRIPAEKMKMDRPHLVPLSRQAIALLKEIQPLTGEEKYVFPGQRLGKAISDGTMNAALRRIGYTGSEQTVHGFRSTASTLLNEQGWPGDAIERQLAHDDADSVRGAYNYAQWLPERRKMMQAWSDYLDELKAAAFSPAK